MALIPTFKIGIWNAWIFMGVFIIQMLAIWLISKNAWERSHIPIGVRRNQFERYISSIGNFIWLLAMLYSFFLPFQLGTIWFYVGFFAFIVGLTILAIATCRFITTPLDQFIETGVYKLSRHPMYLASFLICLGAGIAAVSWLFIVLSILMAFCFYQEGLIEERYCLKKYGKAYRYYINRTPRVIGIPGNSGRKEK